MTKLPFRKDADVEGEFAERPAADTHSSSHKGRVTGP